MLKRINDIETLGTYITFRSLGRYRNGKEFKTERFEVYNTTSSILLGTIYWENGWRQYVFSPAEYTVFSHLCLDEIGEFMRRETEGRRG